MTRTSFLAALTALIMFGCGDAASSEPPASGATAGDEATVCEPGADQTCNDNPAISSLHGACQPDRTCLCNPGIDKNPATGRCL